MTADQLSELQDKLSEIGPWVCMLGTGGVLRAERLGTHRHEQVTLTAAGLLQAVEEAEQRIQAQARSVQVEEGVQTT